MEQKGELFKKCVKNRKYLKGVVHDSCQKNLTVYHVCFFPNQGGKDNIMDRKEYFLDQKSEVSKTSEKSSFSKGLVRVFIKKSSSLPCWFFRQTKAKKIVF